MDKPVAFATSKPNARYEVMDYRYYGHGWCVVDHDLRLTLLSRVTQHDAHKAALAVASYLGQRPATSGTHTGYQDIQACQYEDSPGPCVWDASSSGNGQGMSFYRHANGEVTYVTE